MEDVGVYSLWLFDHPTESSGLSLRLATDIVSFPEIAAVFTEVTGKKAVHNSLPMEEYLPLAEPYPKAAANFVTDPHEPRDESTMTWRENFAAWWRYWDSGLYEPRDFVLLDKIHPSRIRSLKDWMTRVQYDGQRKNILKGPEDLKRAVLTKSVPSS